MNNEKVADVLLNLAEAFESASVKLRRQVKESETGHELNWNPDAIKWVKAQGSRGEYERSEDADNLQFKAMLRDLLRCGGKAFRRGYFYWVFNDGLIVGRKRRK